MSGERAVRGRVCRTTLAAVVAVAAGMVVPDWHTPSRSLGAVEMASSSGPFPGGGVTAFGDAHFSGNLAGMTLAAPAVALAATPSGNGYWVAAADGGVFSFGDARFFGSAGGIRLYAPVVGMAATPDGMGYWLVAEDGGVFSFGDARFYGSMGGAHLNSPIAALSVTPDGKGYWLVANDGGVFSFGDARFFGSMGGVPLAAPVVAMAPTHDGDGYWLAGSDGGIFTFGDATFHGSAANANIGTWVTGIAATPDGGGYWLAAATAGILNFGDAGFFGPSPNQPPFTPTAAIAPTPDGQGYWLLQPDSVVTNFGTEPAVRVAAGQIRIDPDVTMGPFCNPYGPCEEWCALFATWVWEQAGIAIPRLSRVSDVFTWGQANGVVLPPSARPEPGDLVLYGDSPAKAFHMGVVAEVWPNGSITSIEGDSGPEPNGQFAVTFNGPYLPQDAGKLLGLPIYAFVRP